MSLNEPPKLEPKVKEVWAGIRRLSSMSADLQTLVGDLRTALSGYKAYQSEVSDESSFNDLEISLKTDYTNVSAYSDADVAATVDLLEAAFSWSNYSTGVSNQSTYDEYRGYLTSNGLTSVQADKHLQLLQARYGASYTVHTDSSGIGSWDDWETYVSDAGLSADRAATFRTKLEKLYTDFAGFDSAVLQSTDPLAEILNESSHDPDSSGEGLGIKVWESTGTTLSGKTASPGDVSIRANGPIYHETKVGGGDGTTAESTSTVELSYGTTTAASTTVRPGDTTEVYADVTNTGDAEAELTAVFVVNGRVENSKSVTIPSGATRTPSFTFDTDGRDYGEYGVKIGEADSTTIEYLPGGVT